MGRDGSVAELVLVDDVVRHATGQSQPHLPRQLGLNLADPNAELEELLHALMKARPLIAVLVVAGIQERPSATAGLLELVGKLVQHRLDLGLVAFQTLGVKPDGRGNALGFDVLAGILAVLEQTVHEDCVDLLGVECCLRVHLYCLLLVLECTVFEPKHPATILSY